MTYKDKEYINSTYNKDGKHKVRHFTNNGTMTNANNTSNRDADHNWSWIDYWRAMTGIMDEPLHCSSCGKEIFTGTIPLVKSLEYAANKDKTSHKAEGGHIWIIGSDSEPGKIYYSIVP